VALQKRGLLASFDAGKSWQHVNDPLAEGYFPVVHTHSNGTLVAASATEGLLTLEPGRHSADSGMGSSSMAPASTQVAKPKN
jgi:hypothetical protein